MTRREFLAVSGRGLVAAGFASQLGWLSACSAGSAPNWDALARTLRGRLIRSGSPGYQDAALPQNLRYATRQPAGIARCADTADVRTAIRWARDNQVPLVARGGGHSYGGYSTIDGLLIDLNGMTSVTPDPAAGTVKVVGAARNRDVATALQPLEVTVSAGRCPGVGVGGLTLGGGFGFSARQLGLTVDALTETEVVTAAGDVLTCNETQNTDLFWACRGGGGGNFGINTTFTFRTTPVGEVSVYRCTWSSVDPAAMLDAFQRVLAAAPDAFSMRLGFGAPSNPRGPVTLEAIGQYFGPSAQLASLLAPVFGVAAPTTREVHDVTYWEGKDLLADNEGPSAFAERSLFVPGTIDSDGLALFADQLRRRPATVGPSSGSVKVFSWGGAIGRVAPSATAFVHRGALALLSVGASWATDEEPSGVRRLLGWVDGFWQAMRPHTSSESYQNFIDPALTDWEHAYYGANLERLVAVKRRVDPDDIFHFAQSIPTRVT
ncbi:MAG TPA: FAD-binding protein [Acidimicrobiales bacterium]